MVLVIDTEKLQTEIQKSAIETLKAAGATVIEEDDLLDAYCREEASYRLDEFFDTPYEKQTEEMVGEVQGAIRSVIDNDENLYDKIDNEIENVLKEMA